MNEIVSYNDKVLSSMDDVERAARAMAGSGFFTDAAQASKAVVKILAAREIGLGPFAGMVGVNIIQGKPAFSANIMAACVKKSGRYNYRVTLMTDAKCSIVFSEKIDGKWVEIGTSDFTIEEARKAGTKNLDKFPRNMLFARAMSNGVRWFTPDVMNGSVVYTPEELGAETDQEGNVVAVKVVERAPKPTPNEEVVDGEVVEETHEMTLQEAMAYKNSDGQQYGTLPSEILQSMELAIGKALKGADQEQYDIYTKKLKAVQIILANRKQ